MRIVHPCKRSEADILIDNQPWRIDTLPELNHLWASLHDKKGIVFPRLLSTRERLEHKEMEAAISDGIAKRQRLYG